MQKGNTRMPLGLSRLYEEDLMSDEDVLKAKGKQDSPKMLSIDVNNYN